MSYNNKKKTQKPKYPVNTKKEVLKQPTSSLLQSEEIRKENDFTDYLKPKSSDTIQVSSPQKNKWTKQDIIAILSALISILLFVITLLTFYQTKRAVDISEASNNELKKQFEVSIEQFEKSNLPYLQCNNFSLNDFGPNKILKIKYQIENLGNYPAQIRFEKAKLCFLPTIPQQEPFNDLSISPTEYGYYVSKEKTVSKTYFKNKLLAKSTYDSIVNNLLRIYFFGEVEYINPVNKKGRNYRFYTEIFSPPSTEYRIVYNNNQDIK